MNRSTIAWALLLVALLAGCGKKAPQPTPPAEQPPAAEQPAPEPPAPEPQPTEPVHQSEHIRITSPLPAQVGRQLTLTGEARVETFTVVAEDGHNELVRQEVTVTEKAPDWAPFSVTLELSPPTSPGGMIYFALPGLDEPDLVIPVSFER